MSVPYLGDFLEDATVYMPFNTFTSDDPQASSTITNLVAGDIKVHKDGSLTQIVTDGATVIINFDSITGNHLLTIDTSAHADYSIGSDYLVRIEGTTVDAGTVNAWIGHFSIENRFKEVDVVSLGGVVQSLTDLKDFADAGYDPATNKVTGVLLTDTVTTYTGNTPQTGDTYADWANGGRLDLLLDAIKVVTDAQTAITPAELVVLIWDRVLSKANHDISQSAGKRLRQIDAAFEVHSGTAQAGAATTITLDTGASATNNIYRGDRCMIVAGTGIGEHDIIISYVGSTKVATMAETWIITPDNTSEFILVPASVDIETWQHSVVTKSASGLPDVNVNEVGDTGQTAGDLAALITTVDTVVDSILVDTGTTIPGTITTIDNEIATIDGIVDSILVDTAAMQPEIAKMVFTKANELDVNTKSINDAEVVGDGNATPWDGV